MAKILTIDEMLQVILRPYIYEDYSEQAPRMPRLEAERHLEEMEAAADKLARAIAKYLDIDYEPGSADFQDDAGGLCAAFNPKFPGQPLPAALVDLDVGGDWGAVEDG